MRREFIVGVDVGKTIDYTAIAVAEAVAAATGEREPAPGAVAMARDGRAVAVMRDRMVRQFNVTHLERLPLGRPYPSQVEDVAALLDREPLRSGSVTLLLDKSGVGGPVADMFELARLRVDALVPISIHGGDNVVPAGAGFNVPKRDLVGATLSLLQQDRLKIAESLPLAPVLTREMADFEMKISASGHDTYSARVGQHDDLVLSVALIAWWTIEGATTEFFG